MEHDADVTDGKLPRLHRELDRLAAVCAAHAPGTSAHARPLERSLRGAGPDQTPARPSASHCHTGDDHHRPHHRPPGQKGAGMTDEQPRETEDGQPEVEGHKQAASSEHLQFRSAEGQAQEEPEVEGHRLAFGPEKAAGPEKAG
jgi:hypothetical protein